MPDRERALTEDELLFAGLAGSETVGESAPGRVERGGREIYLRAEAVPTALPGEQVVRLDGTLRDNVQVGIDDRVRVRPGSAAGGFRFVIVPDDKGSLSDDELARL